MVVNISCIPCLGRTGVNTLSLVLSGLDLSRGNCCTVTLKCEWKSWGEREGSKENEDRYGRDNRKYECRVFDYIISADIPPPINEVINTIGNKLDAIIARNKTYLSNQKAVCGSD